MCQMVAPFITALRVVLMAICLVNGEREFSVQLRCNWIRMSCVWSHPVLDTIKENPVLLSYVQEDIFLNIQSTWSMQVTSHILVAGRTVS